MKYNTLINLRDVNVFNIFDGDALLTFFMECEQFYFSKDNQMYLLFKNKNDDDFNVFIDTDFNFQQSNDNAVTNMYVNGSYRYEFANTNNVNKIKIIIKVALNKFKELKLKRINVEYN